MTLTRDFKDTIKARAAVDPAFRMALLSEAIEILLADDLQSGKSILRDYINATIGFAGLASQSGLSAKSLMRMFSIAGNPRADNLFKVIAILQRSEGIQLSVRAAA